MPFGITVTRPRVDAEGVGDVLAHVGRAGDDAVGGADHPPLDAVDVRLRVLVDPALVAAVLGRVDGDQPRAAPAAGELARGVGDEPVVGVDEVEAAAELQRPRRACPRSCASTQAMNASRSPRGNSGSRTRWTVTPWRLLLARRREARRRG